jgi:hypothetical protein
MAKAQKALGLCPNTALIERIAERDKLIIEKTQDKSLTKSVMSAKGMCFTINHLFNYDFR